MQTFTQLTSVAAPDHALGVRSGAAMVRLRWSTRNQVEDLCGDFHHLHVKCRATGSCRERDAGHPTNIFLHSSNIDSITDAQSQTFGCLNNRAVGYHWLSWRARRQRQSELNASSIQVGLPMAPAR